MFTVRDRASWGFHGHSPSDYESLLDILEHLGTTYTTAHVSEAYNPSSPNTEREGTAVFCSVSTAHTVFGVREDSHLRNAGWYEVKVFGLVKAFKLYLYILILDSLACPVALVPIHILR